MIENAEFTISAEAAGKRLDAAIAAQFPGVARSDIARAVERGEVRVDGVAVRAKNARLAKNQLVSIAAIRERDDPFVAPAAGPLSVVYEDDAILAFDKPAGQNCFPLSPDETDALANAVVFRYADIGIANVGDNPREPALLHRIDRGTSGLVLAAKTSESYAFVRRQFAAHTVEKKYIAVVQGIVDKPGAVIGHLAHTKGRGGACVMRVVSGAGNPGRDARPMRAETYYEPMEAVDGGRTRLLVTIRTGVTHQIRAQLASIGHPVVGDATYGADSRNSAVASDAHSLRSFSAAFIHPVTRQPVEIALPGE